MHSGCNLENAAACDLEKPQGLSYVILLYISGFSFFLKFFY